MQQALLDCRKYIRRELKIRRANNVSDNKVVEKEGYELDMDVEPTAEEIVEAEKLADKWEAEQDG